jgi:hypothetical protein
MHEPLSSAEARFPMIALYESMHLTDQARVARVNELADDPAFVADAFFRTRQALAPYANTEAFYGRRAEHRVGTELGATKNSWTDETIIATPPWTRTPRRNRTPAIEPASRDRWELHQPLPDDMRPQIRSDGTRVEVRFYTYSALGAETVYEHEDLYDTSSYCRAHAMP